jgi:hypothetical protein
MPSGPAAQYPGDSMTRCSGGASAVRRVWAATPGPAFWLPCLLADTRGRHRCRPTRNVVADGLAETVNARGGEPGADLSRGLTGKPAEVPRKWHGRSPCH